MTKIQEFLTALPDEQKVLFAPIFGSVDKFYTVVYQIASNAHLTDREKPERYEDRMQVIRQIRKKVEILVTSFGLEGEDVVADIASDYFDDFANYREFEPGITNDEFIAVIRKIQEQG